MQEGLERGDVGFFTGMDDIDPEDRRYVTGYKFEKPIRVHDIEYSDDLYDILGPMVDCYAEMAAKAGEDGRLERPFVVLTSSLGFADVVYELLVEHATEVQKQRIRLVTSRQQVQPQDDFDKQFGRDPDRWGVMADVIICTSVIGAGFSIEAHFTHFCAYFFNNILTHMEERQFLQRLRYWSTKIPEDTNKQSYMWVERSHSLGTCCDPKKVRRMYNRTADVLVPGLLHRTGGPLASTELRVLCERNQTRLYHGELWTCWGQTVESEYKEAPKYNVEKKAVMVKRFAR
jgi:hypothetical protein